MIVNRMTAGPNKWTFRIKPIKALLEPYVGDGHGWVDPFAGMSELAKFRNDLNLNSPAPSHQLAEDFCLAIEGPSKALLIYPPFSYRQISNCYRNRGFEIIDVLLVAHYQHRYDTIVTVNRKIVTS